ncbi:hypothetical protein L1887_53094 [Cichorium endivia]|nr:hypothetical protein L1887_53094 [Cichorium endivia]
MKGVGGVVAKLQRVQSVRKPLLSASAVAQQLNSTFFFFLLLHLVKREVFTRRKKNSAGTPRSSRKSSKARTLRLSESRGSHSTFLRFHLCLLQLLSSCQAETISSATLRATTPSQHSAPRCRSFLVSRRNLQPFRMTASERLTRRAAPKSQTRSARSSFVPTADRCSTSLATKTSSSVLHAAPCRMPKVVYDNLSIVTRSHPSAFPSALRQKRQLVNTAASIGNDNKPKEATIKEKCPGCGNDEMNFHTLQLRSADEGTTVFYDCPKCGYKFSQNN